MKQVTTLRKKANRKHAKKELSIHEISPSWSRILPIIPKTQQQQFYKKDRVLDISDAKSCVVGEAYGFNDKYFDSNNEEFCRDCFAHSVEFASILMNKQGDRAEQVGSFVSHWNNNHV